MSTILSMTRDELLPMVLYAQTGSVALNIHIVEQMNALLVVGRNEVLGHELGFAIPYNQIVDGRYRIHVRTALSRLIELLETNFPTTPVPEGPSKCIH